MKRDLLSIGDLSRADCEAIFTLAKTLKAAARARRKHRRLEGRAMAMIFEKPSLRTRVTFEIGIAQLGGTAVYLAPNDIRLGERESVADIARNLSRWVDLIVARTFSHDSVRGLAANATVPVINALSDWEHPCQVLADCFTLIEKRRRLRGLRLAFVGDGNNMVHSWMLAASVLGIEFRLACPAGYEPDPRIVAAARDAPGSRVSVTRSVEEAVRGVDALYTDVWTSMGQEAEETRRREAFRGYQINAETLALAERGALVMHCLPAHRGDEITDDVLDGPQSVVLDQAENRLHVQKAVMVWLSRRK
ncbi:MAG: ornithine carbamoyltransferase [Deltaproteobacteria bacterium]|nr:ornithine carbamoyltransferase [Deltaproteobacteria bacterium]